MFPRQVTIQDVARKAGVSTATVSRAISNPSIVAEKSLEAVKKAIEETGYRVNHAARNLRLQRSGVILVLVPDLGRPFYSGILAGINAACSKMGYAVLITDTAQDRLETDTIANYFRDGRADGAICLDGNISPDALAYCADLGVLDRVIFTCEWPEKFEVTALRSDNFGGARDAIGYLHNLGHRKIGYVGGPAENVLSKSRYQGAMSKMADLDLPIESKWIFDGDFTLESGYEAANAIARLDDRPTAVFCVADMTAFGLISGLNSIGIKVPQDISVIGFDDIEMASFFVPSLTTIRQDRWRLGQESALTLMSRITRSPREPKLSEEEIAVTLVERNSTAPPAA